MSVAQAVRMSIDANTSGKYIVFLIISLLLNTLLYKLECMIIFFSFSEDNSIVNYVIKDEMFIWV